jgi:oligoribonuclease NrnB/cAMP/cGMP phosphodiesterase (DHH superfamily)
VRLTNTKRILSLTHEQDVDGLFSSAILKNAFPDTLVFLTNYGHKNVERTAAAIKFNVARSRKNGTIVISDLGADDVQDIKPIEDAANNARNYGWDFLWLDHHVWSEKIKRRVESFASLILPNDKMKCTAELVYEKFANNRRTCEKIAKFAHIVDFRLQEVHKLPPLPELITYYRSMPNPYPKLQSIVNKASKGIFWDDDLQQDFDQYVPVRESALSAAMKSLTIYDICNHKVAITESPRIISKSILSEKIFVEKPEVNLVILFAPDGKVSIRRNPGSDIKCDVIGQRLNGGGHNYAAAGLIKNSSNESLKIGQVAQELETILRNL